MNPWNALHTQNSICWNFRSEISICALDCYFFKLISFLVRAVLGLLKKKKKKNWSIYQRWNRKEGPEKNLHTYGHLSYDKGGTNIHWRKDLSSINGVEKNEELHVKELN